MTQINSRPSFFPHSSSSQSTKSKNVSYSSDVANNKVNSPARAEELSNISGTHVKVDIPSSIKDYSAIKRAVDNAETVDNSEKVAQLKQQIQSGAYQVDCDAVAEKMLESEF